MAKSELYCWNCSQSLAEVLLPIARLATCKKCKAHLHVCRLCEYYDTRVSNSCREPIAEKVPDKKRANFCGYFQPAAKLEKADGGPVEANRETLEGLFGLAQGSSSLTAGDADKSRQDLEALFGMDNKKPG